LGKTKHLKKMMITNRLTNLKISTLSNSMTGINNPILLMVDVFEYDDYRNYLQDLVNERKQKGFAQSEIADAVNCQPAYLSHVLKGSCNLALNRLVGLQ
jgi:hypothetical protein